MSGDGRFTEAEYANRLAGVWLADFGVAISESFVVTERGGERLRDVARELIVTD